MMRQKYITVIAGAIVAMCTSTFVGSSQAGELREDRRGRLTPTVVAQVAEPPAPSSTERSSKGAETSGIIQIRVRTVKSEKATIHQGVIHAAHSLRGRGTWFDHA